MRRRQEAGLCLSSEASAQGLLSLTLGLSPCQLRNDYMQRYASKVSEGMALQLGCLELRFVTSRPPREGAGLGSGLPGLPSCPEREARVGT